MMVHGVGSFLVWAYVCIHSEKKFECDHAGRLGDNTASVVGGSRLVRFVLPRGSVSQSVAKASARLIAFYLLLLPRLFLTRLLRIGD